MEINPPKATSTPTPVRTVRSRRAIHGMPDNNSVQSPIETGSGLWNEQRILSRSNEGSTSLSPDRSAPRSTSKRRTHLEGSDSGSSYAGKYSDEVDEEPPPKRADVQSEIGPKSRNGWSLGLVLGFLLVALIAGFLALHFTSSSEGVSASINSPLELLNTFEPIEKEFSNQIEDFWRSIRVGIEEVKALDQPQSITFLYESKASSTMDGILKEVSSAALCYLSKCSNKPVIIEGSSLNTTEIMNDYGRIISRYREALETNAVMIVKHLEQIPGKSAQAFHSFCDHYNPVVKNALILFTMKVDEVSEASLTSVLEKNLLNSWKDIGKDDKFQPLFVRISGTVLPVKPEK